MLFVVGVEDEVLEGIGNVSPLRLSLVVVALVGVAVVCQSPTNAVEV
jgi:hypothetical protein